jgi:peptide/nickel transport system substrate-binding protein
MPAFRPIAPRAVATLLVAGGLIAAAAGAPCLAAPKHAIAMHGEPALPPDFTAFPYVNPHAPKGGQFTKGIFGSFDTLNPFNGKGLPAGDVAAPEAMRGKVIESLMTRGYDEPFTLYGLLAQSVDTDPDRTFVTFDLNPKAAFSDGAPVTADDVIFSWQLLRDHGHPRYRTFYAKVKTATALGPRTVRFDFGGDTDREMPLILGLMPVLARHAVDPDRFEETTLTPLLGSGPYVVSEVDAGRSLTLRRNPAWWGRDLAVNRGLWNFDTIRLDYYRDTNNLFEAFKKGLFDVNPETDPGRWETGYDFPAVRDGRVVKEEFPYGLPKVTTALVFNTRRPVFADARVREAVSMLFDFEWINRSFFFGRYRRTASYFEGSELSAHGRPASAAERALLAPFPGAVRDDVMAGTWSPPVSDGSGNDRDTLRRALALFREAGYELSNLALRRRRAARLRDHGRQPRPGAAGSRVRAQSQARRGGTADPGGGRRAVRAAAHRFRLRHDPEPLGPVAVARQRTAAVLELGRGRPAGLAQLHRHAQPRGGRHDRRPARRPRPRDVRHRRARARPRADIGHLRGSALSPAGPVGGALDPHPPSGRHVPRRLSPGDVVARAGAAVSVELTARALPDLRHILICINAGHSPQAAGMPASVLSWPATVDP